MNKHRYAYVNNQSNNGFRNTFVENIKKLLRH